MPCIHAKLMTLFSHALVGLEHFESTLVGIPLRIFFLLPECFTLRRCQFVVLLPLIDVKVAYIGRWERASESHPARSANEHTLANQ